MLASILSVTFTKTFAFTESITKIVLQLFWVKILTWKKNRSVHLRRFDELAWQNVFRMVCSIEMFKMFAIHSGNVFKITQNKAIVQKALFVQLFIVDISVIIFPIYLVVSCNWGGVKSIFVNPCAETQRSVFKTYTWTRQLIWKSFLSIRCRIGV